MKIVLIKMPPRRNIHSVYGSELLTLGETYDGDLTPTMYDPQTLQPSTPSYVVKCNDDKWRKVGGEYFITLEDWREQQLNKIV